MFFLYSFLYFPFERYWEVDGCTLRLRVAGSCRVERAFLHEIRWFAPRMRGMAAARAYGGLYRRLIVAGRLQASCNSQDLAGYNAGDIRVFAGGNPRFFNNGNEF